MKADLNLLPLQFGIVTRFKIAVCDHIYSSNGFHTCETALNPTLIGS